VPLNGASTAAIEGATNWSANEKPAPPAAPDLAADPAALAKLFGSPTLPVETLPAGESTPAELAD
jgi:hypothetical protein